MSSRLSRFFFGAGLGYHYQAGGPPWATRPAHSLEVCGGRNRRSEADSPMADRRHPSDEPESLHLLGNSVTISPDQYEIVNIVLQTPSSWKSVSTEVRNDVQRAAGGSPHEALANARIGGLTKWAAATHRSAPGGALIGNWRCTDPRAGTQESGHLGTISRGVFGLFYELSRGGGHSQIIIATIERPGRTRPESAFLVLSCSRRPARLAPPKVHRRHRTNRRDPCAPRCVPGHDGWRQWQRPGLLRTAPHRPGERKPRELIRGQTLPQRRPSDAERGVGANQTLKVERGVGRECRVINRWNNASRGNGRVDAESHG
jgi:hypothetical protein